MNEGCAMAQAVRAGISLQRPEFAPVSVHVGFVMNQVSLDRFFSEFFGFPLSILFHRGSPCSYITLGMNSRLFFFGSSRNIRILTSG
jgi:hypothetical protein